MEDFQKFKNTADAFKSISKLMKGKIPKSLSKFLSKTIVERELETTLAVADKKLGKALSDEMGIVTKQSAETDELMRVIRFQLSSLLSCNDWILLSRQRRRSQNDDVGCCSRPFSIQTQIFS